MRDNRRYIYRDMINLIGLEMLQTERELQEVVERRPVLLSVQPMMNILQLRRKQGKIP